MFESFNKNIPEEDFHFTKLKKKDVENALPYSFYNEEKIYENMSNMLSHFHKEDVKAIFLTWTSASLFGWTLREAWKKVFPKEKIPDFYFVNPKPIKDLSDIETNNKEWRERRIGQNEREEKRIKEILEEIFRKNKQAKVGIFDEAYGDTGTNEGNIFHRSVNLAKDLVKREMQKIGIDDPKNRIVLDGLGVMDRSHPYVLFEPSVFEVKKSLARKRVKYRTEDYPVIMGKEAIEAFEKIGREIGEKIYKEKFEKTLKLNVERHEEIKIESVFKTIPSEKHPETNEDSVLNGKDIFGVFDGVGGGPAGDIASKTARNYVLVNSEKVFDNVNLDTAKEVLLKIILRADEAVYLASKAENKQKNMSTTASVVKIHTDKDGKNYALVANVGDSRVYKIDKNKKLQQITEDDSLIGDHVSDREKRLKIEEDVSNAKNQEDLNKNPEISFFFNNRRFITKYLGSRKNNSLKIDAVLLAKGDKILITSDGVHDNLATSEIQEIFNSPSNIKEIGEDLINKTIIRSKDLGEMRSKKDDMSFVLIEVK